MQPVLMHPLSSLWHAHTQMIRTWSLLLRNARRQSYMIGGRVEPLQLSESPFLMHPGGDDLLTLILNLDHTTRHCQKYHSFQLSREWHHGCPRRCEGQHEITRYFKALGFFPSGERHGRALPHPRLRPRLCQSVRTTHSHALRPCLGNCGRLCLFASVRGALTRPSSWRR